MWNYTEAFSRNHGLINLEEQDILSRSKIAIAGMGGVGGHHLLTLARLGIQNFTIADGDTFEVVNFNRQCGAVVDNIGENKAEVMAAECRKINPDAIIRRFNNIGFLNMAEFLSGVKVVVDGLDFYNICVRRMLFNEARNRGAWVVTAGPIGFSTAWLVFNPYGMSFDEYFDIHDYMCHNACMAAFIAGLTPGGTHWKYIDLKRVTKKFGPSVGFACNLCAGVVGAEVMKILLDKPVRSAPYYSQFDAYRGIIKQGRLRFHNRGPLQLLKRRFIYNKLCAMT